MKVGGLTPETRCNAALSADLRDKEPYPSQPELTTARVSNLVP